MLKNSCCLYQTPLPVMFAFLGGRNYGVLRLTSDILIGKFPLLLLFWRVHSLNTEHAEEMGLVAQLCVTNRINFGDIPHWVLLSKWNSTGFPACVL